MNSFLRSVYQMGAGSSTVGGGGGGPPFGRADFPGNRWSRRHEPQQQQQQQQSRAEEQRAAPPASRRAIRQLPTVVVTPEDLVDENNRECCICLDENCLKDRVIRLPCAHIYHPRCITDWLLKHCTCPVCRYELPTDDPSYEPLRIERMKQRKPRFARYELDRMSARELRTLACSRLQIRGAESALEKPDLIRMIVQSGKIEVVSAPEPVERENVAELRAMGVGKLRRAMEEAGVFFDRNDVVEKEDMVQIFVKSGRVVFRQEEEDTERDVAEGYGYGLKQKSLSEEGDDEATSKAQLSRSKSEGSDAPMDAMEAGDNGNRNVGNAGQSERCSEKEAMDLDVASHASGNISDGSGVESFRTESPIEERREEQQSEPTAHTEHAHSAYSTSVESSSATEPAFASRTVSELRALGRELRVDLSTCIEKREMVEKLAARVSSRR